jgi:2'-5' RNA ligase
MKNTIMRVFIAVDISEQVRNAVGRLQEKLRRLVHCDNKSVKWVRPESMHLTMKFLGEIKDDDIVDVCKAVEEVAALHNKFELNVGQVGYFGGKSARVLWVGTEQGAERLNELAEKIDEKMYEIGYPKETRRFTGHLTLCRIKNGRVGYELARAVDELEPFAAGVSGIEAVTVYQSQLERAGAVYTALARYELKQL